MVSRSGHVNRGVREARWEEEEEERAAVRSLWRVPRSKRDVDEGLCVVESMREIVCDEASMVTGCCLGVMKGKRGVVGGGGGGDGEGWGSVCGA